MRLTGYYRLDTHLNAVLLGIRRGMLSIEHVADASDVDGETVGVHASGLCWSSIQRLLTEAKSH
jgi:hypothetical protein